MGTILKANKYRIVDNHAFDMPLPLKFEIRKKDSAIAEYEISEDEKISCRIITKYKEYMLTTIHRPLNISDIYYLFSCRVFQDRTPFTMFELSLLGLEKYNVYNILKKTRGITPFDSYWIKFDGDDCTYEKALEDFNALTTPAVSEQETPPAVQAHADSAVSSAPVVPAEPPKPQEQPPKQIADLNEVLSQHKVDVSKFVPAPQPKDSPVIMPDENYDDDTLVNNKMSEDEIEALLGSLGLSEEELPAPAPSSGGAMSQEEIEKLLAAKAEPEPEPSGKMSQDDIEKLLAANAAQSVPAPEPAETSGGKMSQDDIAALFAANAAQSEPAPEPAEPSGGKMSQDDIEALLKSMQEDASK